MAQVTKEYIRKVLKKYMLDNNLGFVSVSASMNIAKTNVVMNLIEEEEVDPLDELLN